MVAQVGRSTVRNHQFVNRNELPHSVLKSVEGGLAYRVGHNRMPKFLYFFGGRVSKVKCEVEEDLPAALSLLQPPKFSNLLRTTSQVEFFIFDGSAKEGQNLLVWVATIQDISIEIFQFGILIRRL